MCVLCMWEITDNQTWSAPAQDPKYSGSSASTSHPHAADAAKAEGGEPSQSRPIIATNDH